MSESFIKTLTKWVHDYKKEDIVTPLDFINQNFNEEEQIEQKEKIKAFFEYNHHEKFLEDVAQLFLKDYKFFHANLVNVKIQFWFALLYLNDDNKIDIITHSQYYTKEMCHFLSDKIYHKLIARIGCKYFENEYVMQKIIDPLVEKQGLIGSVMDGISAKHSMKIPPKKCTVPVEFEFRRLPKPPAPPANTPMDEMSFYAIEPPQSTHVLPYSDMKKLGKAHLRNKERSENLLKQASGMRKALTEPKKPVVVQEEEVKSPEKVKPIPPKKDVQIKENLTTTLREAARLLKQHEEEIKTIEDIIKGGCTLQKMETIETEYREQQHQQELESIQKKRLQGLISYEEAIIAKKRLLDDNKKRVQEFKDARAELIEHLEKWREEEQEKMKQKVEKCHQSKKDVKEIERKTIEEKQNQVRMQQLETKEMLRRAFEEQEKELSKKIELIKEIKAIHEISMHMNAQKEFDPTETQNLGLFCEMSIAELQERLVLAKMEMKQELDAKRQRILERKTEQQQMIENVRNFIAQNRRMSKTKTVPIRSTKLERSPDLLELEKVLNEKRSLRLKS